MLRQSCILYYAGEGISRDQGRYCPMLVLVTDMDTCRTLPILRKPSIGACDLPSHSSFSCSGQMGLDLHNFLSTLRKISRALVPINCCLSSRSMGMRTVTTLRYRGVPQGEVGGRRRDHRHGTSRAEDSGDQSLEPPPRALAPDGKKQQQRRANPRIHSVRVAKLRPTNKELGRRSLARSRLT